MLHKSPHFADALSDAQAAAKSMQGRCIELIDLLTRLQGANMRDLANEMPFEFAALSASIAQATEAAMLVDGLREQQRRDAL